MEYDPALAALLAQADMDIYEYFKAQGAKIESPPELFTGDYSCYLYHHHHRRRRSHVVAHKDDNVMPNNRKRVGMSFGSLEPVTAQRTDGFAPLF